MTHIIADVIETILKEDKWNRASFMHTSYLVEFTRLDNNDSIKTLSIVSKIIIPLTNAYASEIDDIMHSTSDMQDNLVHSDLVNNNLY